jgi:cysteine-rich repeat protein
LSNIRSVLVLATAVAAAAVAAPAKAQPAGCTVGATVTHGERVYYRCDNDVHWGVARDRCAAYAPNGTAYYLTRIDDSTENGQVDTLIGGADAWIGASDIVSEQQWRWVFGDTLFCSNSPGPDGCAMTFGYNNWDPGEPNNASGSSDDQHCAAMTEGDGRWDDRFCGNRADRGGNPGYEFDQINWVCEGRTQCGNGLVQSGETCDDGNVAAGDGCNATCQIQAGYSCTGGTGPTNPSDCDLVCATGGGNISNFAGSQYEFCNLGTADWAHAAAYCSQRTPAGRLVRIDNALEQQHVQAQLGGVETWSDGVRVGAVGGAWEWANNGDDFYSAGAVSQRYSYWDAGEPSGNGACLQIRPGEDSRWDDVACTDQRAILCERANVVASCGDGIVATGEACDDGNANPADGCASCVITPGWFCSRSGGACSPACTVAGNAFSGAVRLRRSYPTASAATAR